tara:strand:- start:175 stop:411 length:237 start_codon:yes stop_codon:yes gene_type:complete
MINPEKKYSGNIEIKKRAYDGLYNVWANAQTFVDQMQLSNYSSKWVVIGTSNNFHGGMGEAKKYYDKIIKEYQDEREE